MDGLTRVYHVVCEALVYAPEEDICSEREKEAYADLANLKNSLEMLFQERGDDICRETPWYTEEWYREDLENALENADVAPTGKMSKPSWRSAGISSLTFLKGMRCWKMRRKVSQKG